MPFPDSTLLKHLDGKSQAMLLNMKLNPRAADPATNELVAFVPWFNTTAKEFKYYDGDRILTIESLPQPVISVVSVLPSSPTEGDRYLLKVGHDDIPEIHEYKSGAWVQEPFKDKDTVFDTRGSKYVRLDTRLEHEVSTIVARRVPTSSDLDYPLGQEWELEDKSAAYKLVSVEQFGTAPGNSGYPGNAGLASFPNEEGSEVWQTFTPPETNGLSAFSIALLISGSAGDNEVVVEVREGVGTAGRLLSSTTKSIVRTGGGGIETVLFTLPTPVGVRGGEKYTWVLRRTVFIAPINTLRGALGNSSTLDPEVNSLNRTTLSFGLTFVPVIQATWVDLKHLIPKLEVELPTADYWLDPILGIFDTADIPTENGDRYIDSADITKVKVVGGDDEEFLDGASVVAGDRIIQRKGTTLEDRVLKVYRDRAPTLCDILPNGTEWDFNSEVYKAIANRKAVVADFTIGDLGTGGTVQLRQIEDMPRWQTFTPATAGAIKSLQFFTQGGLAPSGVEVKIYKGEGIEGELVSAQSMTWAGGTTSPVVTFACPAIVEVGRQYTWSIQRIAGSTAIFYLAYHLDSATVATRNYLEGEITDVGTSDYLFSLVLGNGENTQWVKLLDLINDRTTTSPLPLILEVGLSSDTDLSSISTRTNPYDSKIDVPLPFDNVKIAPVVGQWISNYYKAADIRTLHPTVSVRFMPHNIEPWICDRVGWQISKDDGATWEELLYLWQEEGEGFEVNSCKFDTVKDAIYQVVATYNSLPTSEEVVTMYQTHIDAGDNSPANQALIRNANLLLDPIIDIPIITNQNLTIIELTYGISINAASRPPTSLRLDLREDGVATILTTQTFTTGIDPGTSFNAVFSGIEGFNGITPKKFILDWEIL